MACLRRKIFDKMGRKAAVLPQAYKAMCGQCGEIVQHWLDNSEALPRGNGNLVAPLQTEALRTIRGLVHPSLRTWSRRGFGRDARSAER